MTFVTAAALTNRFAAIAAVSGIRLVSGEPNRMPSFLPNTPERPFPLLYIHGTADTVAPYNGGQSSAIDSFVFPPVLEVLAEWVDSNGGTSLEQTASIPGIGVTDGPAVSLFQCNDCGSYITASGDEMLAEVIHMRINGGGHVWPASDSLVASNEEKERKGKEKERKERKGKDMQCKRINGKEKRPIIVQQGNSTAEFERAACPPLNFLPVGPISQGVRAYQTRRVRTVCATR